MNNIKKIIILYFFVLFPIIIYSDNIKNDFIKANEFYAKGQFNEALKIYNNLLKTDYDNFNINYNMGCSYYKLNQFGKARFYYERALVYNPFDKDLSHNLRILYDKILKSPELGEQIIINNRFIFFIPIFLTAIIVFILVLSIIIFLFLFFKFYTHKRIFLVLLSLFIFLNLIFTSLFFIQYFNINSKKFVVTDNAISVFIGPNENETVLMNLEEGYSNIYYDQDGNFVEIKLNDGLKGWINKKSIIINP